MDQNPFQIGFGRMFHLLCSTPLMSPAFLNQFLCLLACLHLQMHLSGRFLAARRRVFSLCLHPKIEKISIPTVTVSAISFSQWFFLQKSWNLSSKWNQIFIQIPHSLSRAEYAKMWKNQLVFMGFISSGVCCNINSWIQKWSNTEVENRHR